MAKREDPIDALFKLPLTEFVDARKKLAAQLKKTGSKDEAASISELTKPPVSAWTVNQLYWHEREAFDELIATGQRFRKAQASGKVANMREALEARREAIARLSDLATEILTAGGHNPSLDTLRRITSTLEALSASTSSEGPQPGRLMQDVDPPGFDSFGSFVPSAAPPKRIPPPPKPTPAKKSSAPPAKTKQETPTAEAARREERQAKLAAAKAALKEARKTLTAATANAKSLEAAQKRAEAVAKEAEKQKRQAEERFKKADAAAQDAAERVVTVGVDLEEASKELKEAERAVEKASQELEMAFR